MCQCMRKWNLSFFFTWCLNAKKLKSENFTNIWNDYMISQNVILIVKIEFFKYKLNTTYQERPINIESRGRHIRLCLSVSLSRTFQNALFLNRNRP